MSEQTKKTLLDATASIRDEYLEDAAAPAARSRPPWVRFAVAAVLALLLGGTALLWSDSAPQTEYTPFFAIRAYAQDGTEATLDSAGDSSSLTNGESELFPNREVYVLDVSLTDASGNPISLENTCFECRHNGKMIQPGQTDENLSISWLDENGFYGYRLVGWCEEWDYIDITIRNENGLILHQKTVRVDFAEQYRVDVYTSYTYEEGLTTEELIAKLFDTGQQYWIHTAIASSPYVEYRALVYSCGGFKELEERSDAASLLLARWLREMEQAEHNYTSLEYSGQLGLILSQDAHWNHLTQEEISLIENYVTTRREYGSYTPFPGKQTFSYEIKMEGSYTARHQLLIDYDGKTEQDEAEHFFTMFMLSGANVEPAYHGWEITGWFDEPTELTLTVIDRDGAVLRRDVLLITPTEDGYQIDILEQTP